MGLVPQQEAFPEMPPNHVHLKQSTNGGYYIVYSGNTTCKMLLLTLAS